MQQHQRCEATAAECKLSFVPAAAAVRPASSFASYFKLVAGAGASEREFSRRRAPRHLAAEIIRNSV